MVGEVRSEVSQLKGAFQISVEGTASVCLQCRIIEGTCRPETALATPSEQLYSAAQSPDF